jgi:hypothetical protein
MEEKLLAFTAKALNLEQDEIKDILATDGGTEILDAKLVAHLKDQKDSGFKSAERKSNTNWESKLKAAFELQSDTKGLALIEEALEVIETKLQTAKPTEITETQIKKHPLFLNMEKQLQDVEKNLTTKFEQEKSQLQEAWQQEKVFTTAKEKATAVIDSLNLVLDPDPAKAAAQKSIIIRDLEQYKFMDNSGELVLLDKEGNRLENETGHAIKFEDAVKKIATTYFTPQKVEQRSSPNRQAEEGTAPIVTMPKTREEYAKFLNDTSIEPSKKLEVISAPKAWES